MAGFNELESTGSGSEQIYFYIYPNKTTDEEDAAENEIQSAIKDFCY